MAIGKVSPLENIAGNRAVNSIRLSNVVDSAKASVAQTMNITGNLMSGISSVNGVQYKPMAELSPIYIRAQWNAYDVAKNTMRVAIKKGNPMDYAILLGKTAFSRTMEQYNFHDVHYQPGIPQLIDLMV